jgi:PmbA protein
MPRKLGRGPFVTELMGQGFNHVTGAHSRRVAGFGVEGGRIVHPVHEVTIAGSLAEMFEGNVAIGADACTLGRKCAGAVLVDRMKLAGA